MRFRDKYDFLSNFYPCEIIAWGRELLRGKERPWLAVDVDQGRPDIKSEVRTFIEDPA